MANAAKARWAERNQVKRAAHRILGNAVKYGKVVRGPCEAKGSHRGRIEGHHDDYYKPLEVRWLCAKHHKEIHA